IAEVAGYGPGVASDSIYEDFGGGTGDTPIEPGPYFHPVPSWYNTLTYPYLNTIPGLSMGSTYLQNHPLPAYVNSNVISMRQVADMAIQLYKGGSVVIKYDTVKNYDPRFNPSKGIYAPLSIPCPSPVITVEGVGKDILARIKWGNQVESISNATPGFEKMHAPLSYYKILRSVSGIGPWKVLDSVSIGDSRYFNAAENIYVYDDLTAHLNNIYYYAVVAVDSLGGKSGLTNLTKRNAQYAAVQKLNKVYAVPNPFVVNSGYEKTPDKIGIYGLPAQATIRIYSYSGQLVQTIEHNVDEYATGWAQISLNNQWVASGVYFFIVEDKATGDKAWNKFVIIH
ncbi:MAG: T9SS C-terminal target domain-containing protein, partial [Ignavibacteria bacterium]|nr:T9SS C-terminal target domain-containing protein [Ignavibacteria bacterium]